MKKYMILLIVIFIAGCGQAKSKAQSKLFEQPLPEPEYNRIWHNLKNKPVSEHIKTLEKGVDIERCCAADLLGEMGKKGAPAVGGQTTPEQ
jgi:hypothetical protein